MEKGLITRAIQELVIRDGKDLLEVQQYLLMKHRIQVELLVLEKRLKKMRDEEKAVA